MDSKITIILTFFITLIACKQQTNSVVKEVGLNKSNTESAIITETDLGKAIDSLLRKEMDMGFSGSVLVAKNNKIILQNGYGWTDSTKTVLITPKTKFYIASTTKGMTGSIVVLSEQRGVLSLKDSLYTFFPQAPEAFKYITIHDMLTHTSGLRDNYETFGSITVGDNVELIFNNPPVKKPSFIYSGAGYWMTAAVIEKAIQKPYEKYAREVLFKPAGMNNTFFWFEIDEHDKNTVAQKLSAFPPNNEAPNWGFRASGGILTDISDLYSYFNAVAKEGVMSREGFDKIAGSHLVLGGDIGIGYGWYISTTERGTQEIWSRGGESFGHNSAIRYFKDENIIIAILTNCGQLQGENREANRTVSDKIEKIIF